MPAVSIPAGAVAVPAQPDPTSVEIVPEAAGRLSRGARQTVAVGILAVIALVAALYLARAFFVPLLIGILASYALSPLVDWLEVRRVPRAIGAALTLAALVGAMSWVGSHCATSRRR
jgi:predicted PurR-regulated permease PerM